jgi:putative DNA primase/helicase
MEKPSDNIHDTVAGDNLSDPLLLAALAYARRGWAVFPLHHPVNDRCSCGEPDCGNVAKHPRYHKADLQHGLKDATTDLEQIRRWWTRWPQANIGVVTGAISGLVVLDIDPRNGGHLSLEDLQAEHSKLPHTIESQTGGGGRHLFFKHPGGKVRSGSDKLGPGLDLKADGGYIVAPPSLHASGLQYVWEASSVPGGCVLAAVPAWFPLYDPHTSHVLDDQAEADAAGAHETVHTEGSPGDDYNRRVEQGVVRAKLERCGWRVVERRGEVEYLCRPGKEGRGWSATLGHVAPKVLYVFTSSAPPFTANRAYRPFSVYGLLEHGGDFKKAARFLAECGYGRNGHRPTTSAPEPDTSEAQGDERGRKPDLPTWLPWSDQTNAEALVRWYGRHMRYCEAWGCWLTWRQGRWVVDDTGRVMRFAKQTVKRLLEELDDMEGIAERKAFLAHITRSLSMRSLEAMVKSARSEPGIAVTPELFDRDPWLFNVKNGTIDLRTGELRPHQRDDLLTKMSPVSYDEQAECPLWIKFLGEIYAGDQELVTFIQKATGYTLTGSTREQVLFICHGSGTNGKSTQIRVMSALMGEGEYALKTNFRAFAEATSQRQPASIEYYIAKLYNVRLAYASEGDEGAKFSEGLIKDVTGGEPITGRHPYGRPFTFQPLFKLWFGTNHEPAISGTDPAIWRRPRKIPYTVNFEDCKDETLFDKLIQEIPGILRWAVKGCLLWQMNGLEPPKAVKDATTAYRRAMDVVGRFIEERCILTSYGKVESTTLYHAYVKWCDDNGETALSQRKLAGQLHERGLKNDTKNEVTRRIQWTGIDLEK